MSSRFCAPGRASFVAGLALLLAGLASPGFAAADQQACRLAADAVLGDAMWLADSDVRAQGEEGLGGTGVVDPEENAEKNAEDEGLGGTGLRAGSDRKDERRVRDGEDGIGGTGVVGTVTGFGSVCVNGLRLLTDDETRVVRWGARASVTNLARGDLVVAEVHRREDGLHAAQIAIRPALVGRVTRDAAGRSLEVMGQQVLVPNAAVLELDALEDYETGLAVEVSGLRRQSGEILASRIALAPRDVAPSAMGHLVSTREGALQLSGTSIRVARGLVDPSIDLRLPVVVLGAWDAEARRFIPREVVPALDFESAPSRLSIEGLMPERVDGAARDAVVRVTGFPIDLGPLAREGRLLRGGERVWIGVELGGGELLRARRIDVRPRGGGRPAPERHGARDRKSSRVRGAAALGGPPPAQLSFDWAGVKAFFGFDLPSGAARDAHQRFEPSTFAPGLRQPAEEAGVGDNGLPNVGAAPATPTGGGPPWWEPPPSQALPAWWPPLPDGPSVDRPSLGERVRELFREARENSEARNVGAAIRAWRESVREDD